MRFLTSARNTAGSHGRPFAYKTKDCTVQLVAFMAIGQAIKAGWLLGSSIWVYPPSDWLCVDQCCVRHHFHPGLHVFGRVCAEVVGPHVGVGRLAGRE